jgi:transcriptional regulator of acetoin/glycerol metabolism
MVAIGTPCLPPESTPARGPAASRTDRDAVVAALDRHGGNVRAAARDLGISRPTFYAWCLRHGLDPAAFRRG